MRYKLIKEYERFYLTEDEKKRKECFDKVFYKPDEHGYIIKKVDLKHEQQFYCGVEDDDKR